MMPVSVPPADEVTEGWWQGTREHRLLVQACDHCGETQHPPRAVCIHCHRVDGLGWRETTGLGSVDSFTVVHRGPRPDLEVPYVVARVRLEAGPILLSRLEGRDASDEAWTIGDRVAATWVDLDDGRAIPVFVPEVSGG